MPYGRSEYEILGATNVYESLERSHSVRNALDSDYIERFALLSRIHASKQQYLNQLETEHKQSYDDHPGRKDLVFKSFGENPVVIGSLPAWRLQDSSLENMLHYAISSCGSIYRTAKPHSNSGYVNVDNDLLRFSVVELSQLADAIDAHITRNPWQINKLLQSRNERLRGPSS